MEPTTSWDWIDLAQAVHTTFVCLVNTTSTEVPACYRTGPAFTTADAMLANTLDLQDGTSYKAVHLPLSLHIPFGIHNMAKGTVTKSTLDILDWMGPSGHAASLPMTRPAATNSAAVCPNASAR